MLKHSFSKKNRMSQLYLQKNAYQIFQSGFLMVLPLQIIPWRLSVEADPRKRSYPPHANSSEHLAESSYERKKRNRDLIVYLKYGITITLLW